MSRCLLKLMRLSGHCRALCRQHPSTVVRRLDTPMLAVTSRLSVRNLSVADRPKHGLSVDTPPESEAEMSVDDFEELATSEENRKKIHLILLEYVNSRDTVGRVPSKLTVKEMTELLALRSTMARSRYFNYLFKTEMSVLAAKRLKERRRLEREAAKEEKRKRALEDGSINHIQYGPENTIFLFIRDPTMSRFYNYRQMYAAMFGQTLVYDLDYESEMTKREIVNAAEQLQEAYAANRTHPDPFNLVFCNVGEGGQYKRRLLGALPHLEQPNCLITTTEKSYLDLYPRERLVYLTPDAKQTLSYDHDAIYIIGALVDKSTQKPLSLAKAKRDGIRVAKLPLENYLQWGKSASKTLTLNSLINILLEMKTTGDWKKAFNFVPRRKLKSEQELQAEAELAAKKEAQKKRVLRRLPPDW
uniref:RNA (guanine-9-)-methyltransferase domain-containing protein 1 n=1 Tax=Ixodes ricinus TaxID=34613 RepID=A0A147BFT4_IXORI